MRGESTEVATIWFRESTDSLAGSDTDAASENRRLWTLLRRHFPRAPDATDEDVEQAIREELEAMRGDVHD